MSCEVINYNNASNLIIAIRDQLTSTYIQVNFVSKLRASNYRKLRAEIQM